jgi:hypothetical protein
VKLSIAAFVYPANNGLRFEVFSMIKKIITSTALLATLSTAAVYASTAPAAPAAAVSASAVPAGIPSTTPITNPDGDMYLANVVAAVSNFSHREILSIFSAASGVPLIQNGQPVDMKALRAAAATAPGSAPNPTPGDNPSPTQGVVCLQKLSNGGIYRSHSNNRNARGPVSSKSDLDAFTPLFDLKAGGKFVLNVAANADGTGDIISYIGQVVAKDGDGKAGGDTLCFARYLQVSPAAAAAAASAASAAMAAGAGAAKAAAASGSAPAAAPATSTSTAPASTSSSTAAPAAATA